MNEEEKKAVEFVKKRTKELKKYAKRENETTYDDIVLNLVDRLLKENKELENDNKYLRERELYLEERITDIIDFFKSTMVPIQKIKNKIKYLDNQQKQWLEDRELKTSDTEIIFARDILQELLEK